MDRDDAEKRIGDLERQIAEARAAAGSATPASAMPPPPTGFPPPPPTGFPPPPVNWQPAQGRMAGPGYGRVTGPRYIMRRLWSAFLATIAVLLLLALFGSAAYNYYAYRAGTPTTATIEKYTKGCVSGGHPGVTGMLVDTNPLFDYFGVENCIGTWSVGGTSQSGPILAVESIQPAGSTLDVRVLGGKAYTTTSGKHSLLWMIGIGVPGLVIAVIVGWRRRTGRSSGGWLRGFLRFAGDVFSDD